MFLEQNVDFVNISIKQKTQKYFQFDQHFKRELTDIRLKNSKSKPFNTIWKYFDNDDMFISEINSSSVRFEHTFPLSLGISNFIFHIETVETLFLPFKKVNNVSSENMEEHKDYRDYKNYIEDILISDKCRSILCNYNITKKNLMRLFPKLEPKKITTLNFLDMHLAHDKQRNQLKDNFIKNRIFFNCSGYKNVSSNLKRELNQFIDLSKNILGLNELKHLRPTLYIPLDCQDDFDFDFDFEGIEVIRGFMPSKIYDKILRQSLYFFLPSAAINSKEMIDCVRTNTAPIVRRHLGYLDLGFNDDNSIFLSDKITDPLTLYNEKIEKINFSKLLKTLKLKEKNRLQPWAPDKILQCSAAGMLEMQKFCNIFKNNKNNKTIQSSVPILRETVTLDKFATTPRYFLYGRFNGIHLFTNQEYFVISESAKAPSNFSKQVAREGDSNNHGIIHKSELSRKINNILDDANLPGKWTYKDRFRRFIQNYRIPFLIFRFLYRLFKKLINFKN